MNLIRCYISGFGRLVDLSLRFSPGLNVVFAPNEGGKTSLQHCLLALLYGPLRPGNKSQRRPEPWAEAYKPWGGGDYGGVLWCGLASGGELEVRRRFGRDENPIELRTATGEDVTRRYVQQKNSEVLFAQALLGMPKELFESVSIVRENRSGELGSSDTIRDRIANLATTGDEQVSIQRSLERLDAALEAIGSDRAPTRPYRQAQERLAALGRERAQLDARRAEFEGWVAELERTRAAAGDLERERDAASRGLAAARRRDAADVLRALEEIQASAAEARAALETSPFRQFPAEDLQELENLAGAGSSIDLRREEAGAALTAARARLEEARVERDTLLGYSRLEPEGDAQRATEQLVRYADAALLRRGAAGLLEKTGAEVAALREKVAALPPQLAETSVDWEGRARDAAEKKLAASQGCAAAASDLVQLLGSLGEARGARARRRTLAAGAALAAAVLFAAGYFLTGSSQPAAWLALAAGLALGCVAAVAAARLGAMRRTVERLADEVQTAEGRQAALSREAEAAPDELAAAAAAVGAASVDDFLARVRDAAELRLQLAAQRERAADLEARLRDLSREELSAHTTLEQRLSVVGLSCPRDPDAARAQVDAMLAQLRRFRAFDAVHADWSRRVDALAEQQSRLEEERGRVAARATEILARARVDSIEAFREGCRGRERAGALAAQAASFDREYRRLAAGRDLDAWRAEIRGFDAELSGSPELLSGELPPTAEAERQERAAAAAFTATRERHARLSERVAQAFENYRPVSEIEEDSAEVERALARLSVNRAALVLARTTLDHLQREQQEVLAPQLNQAVEARFLRIGGERYSGVKITPAFEVLVREASNHELRNVESLSRATRDQIYLALRFAILDLVTEGYEPSPCLLDEPFAAYDRHRLAAAFEVVKEEAKRRQVFLFTCRSDVYHMALEGGAWMVELAALAEAQSLTAGSAAGPDRPREER